MSKCIHICFFGGGYVNYNAIDIFSGCGGMTAGLIDAGFRVVAAVEIDKYAAQTYQANYKQNGIVLFEEDIRDFEAKKILEILNGEPLHLLAGCPPCQGFSTLRRRNKKGAQRDKRNSLILEYLRLVEELKPISIMLENVPGIENYSLFKRVFTRLSKLGYSPKYKVVDVAYYGVPQRRKRLVMIGSLLGKVEIPDGDNRFYTVRDYIGQLESVESTNDSVHKRYPQHSEKVMERIRLTPHDGGSRKDLPQEYTLECHKNKEIGFSDVYGRLRWDDVASTITGGCLNPSKGRFLHPEEDRCITAREAALLQTFKIDYVFPDDIPMSNIALMIGNALPPLFCKVQSEGIRDNLDVIFMPDIYDKNKRSDIMRKVKNKNTKPELAVRKLLTQMGYRYRLQTKHLSCKPDIIFPSKKKAIFINGCFWHGHDCNRGHLPETNKDFWQAKITENKERDQNNYLELKNKGWSYLVIWQCDIKASQIDMLKSKLSKFLSQLSNIS